MFKTFAAIVVAALIAGAFAGFPTFIEPVSATSTAGVAPIAAPACPERGWPYQHCGEAKVRIVTTDRLK
jgi:hypothetical protein